MNMTKIIGLKNDRCRSREDNVFIWRVGASPHQQCMLIRINFSNQIKKNVSGGSAKVAWKRTLQLKLSSQHLQMISIDGLSALPWLGFAYFHQTA